MENALKIAIWFFEVTTYSVKSLKGLPPHLYADWLKLFLIALVQWPLEIKQNIEYQLL